MSRRVYYGKGQKPTEPARCPERGGTSKSAATTDADEPPKLYQSEIVYPYVSSIVH